MLFMRRVTFLLLFAALVGCEQEPAEMPRAQVAASSASSATTPAAATPPAAPPDVPADASAPTLSAAPVAETLPTSAAVARPAAPAEATKATAGRDADPVTATGVAWIAPAGRSPFGDEGETRAVPPLRLPDAEEAERDADVPGIPWDQAHLHLGERITVQGKVVGTHASGSRVVFLNFDRDWKGKFYVPVFRNAFDSLPEPAAGYFLNKTVRVTGTVELFRGTPNIEVNHLRQIKVVVE